MLVFSYINCPTYVIGQLGPIRTSSLTFVVRAANNLNSKIAKNLHTIGSRLQAYFTCASSR
jgi:hypothetical protein